MDDGTAAGSQLVVPENKEARDFEMLTVTVLAADVETSGGGEGGLISVLLAAAYLLAFLFVGVLAAAKLYLPSLPETGSRGKRALDASQDRERDRRLSEDVSPKQD